MSNPIQGNTSDYLFADNDVHKEKKAGELSGRKVTQSKQNKISNSISHVLSSIKSRIKQPVTSLKKSIKRNAEEEKGNFNEKALLSSIDFIYSNPDLDPDKKAKKLCKILRIKNLGFDDVLLILEKELHKFSLAPSQNGESKKQTEVEHTLYRIARRFSQLSSVAGLRDDLTIEDRLKYSALLEMRVFSQYSEKVSKVFMDRVYVTPVQGQVNGLGERLRVKKALKVPYSIQINAASDDVYILPNKMSSFIASGEYKRVLSSFQVSKRLSIQPQPVVEAKVKTPYLSNPITYRFGDKQCHARLRFVGEYNSFKKEASRLSLFYDRYDGSLDKELGKFTLREQLLLARDAMMGIKVMHDEGYIHGDIKPANILYKRNNSSISAYITDYDFSCKIDSESQYLDQVYGTIYYTAPEIWINKDILTQSALQADVFALGLTFLLLINIPPADGKKTIWSKIIDDYFNQENDPDLFEKGCRLFQEKIAESMELLQSKEEKEYINILSKMVDFDPNNRPSISECIKAMRKLLGEVTSSA